MKHETIHLSFTELWNSRTVRETNSPATWSHPDLSAAVTQRHNNGVEMGSHLRANPQYMQHFKSYNLISNRKKTHTHTHTHTHKQKTKQKPGNSQYSLPVPMQSESTNRSTPSTQQSFSFKWPTLCQHVNCPQQLYIPFSSIP